MAQVSQGWERETESPLSISDVAWYLNWETDEDLEEQPDDESEGRGEDEGSTTNVKQDEFEKEESPASTPTVITSQESIEAVSVYSSEHMIYPCLKHFDISDSRLKLQNIFDIYPMPEDPGIGSAFYSTSIRRRTSFGRCAKIFQDHMEREKLRSIGSLKDSFIQEKIDLSFYGLESRVIGPLTKALACNQFVCAIDLKDNTLSPFACKQLGNLIAQNNRISTLILAGCRIGEQGARCLAGGIDVAGGLVTIDLSGCNLAGPGFLHLAKALGENMNIETVNLSHNDLEDATALHILLSLTTSIKQLDLSWNRLNSSQTWNLLVDGFYRADSILEIDLSRNGLGAECIRKLTWYLGRSKTLEKLNLRGNWFIVNDAVNIAAALSKNSTLKELRIGDNPIKTEGVAALLQMANQQSLPSGGLRLLDMSNVWVTKEILEDLNMVTANLPWLTIKFGGIISNYVLKGPNLQRIHVRRADYETKAAKKKSKKRKTFAEFILSLSDKPVITKETFGELIQDSNMKISQSLLEELIEAFAETKTKINLGKLKAFYLQEYPDVGKMAQEKQRMEEEKARLEAEEAARLLAEEEAKLAPASMTEEEYEYEYEDEYEEGDE